MRESRKPMNQVSKDLGVFPESLHQCVLETTQPALARSHPSMIGQTSMPVRAQKDLIDLRT